MKIVNLSSRSFLNTRPVVRLATALWVVGALLLAANLWSYGTQAARFADSRRRLAEIESAITANRQQMAEIERELSTLDVGDQNEQVAFLNSVIARRTFPWSLLFEQLEEILPQDVRLTQVRPEIQLAELPGVRQTRASTSERTTRTRRREPQRRAGLRKDQVALKISGASRDDDALLDFVDALFASPHFEQPVLHQESRDTSGGEIRFSLDVVYLIKPSEAEPATPETPELKLGETESDGPAAEEMAAVEGTPRSSASTGGPRTGEPSTIASATGQTVAPLRETVPTLRREPGAPVEPAPPAGDRPTYLTPSQKRRLEAEAAARRATGDGTSSRSSDRSGASAPAGVFFGSAEAPPAGEPIETPTAPAAAPTARQRPTLERPRLGPSPPAGLAPEASASPRLRRGGRP